ncbi:MAG TPA: PDZ domain-containing protein [Candidatus Angelobacter sp.]|nr:PDZ domain-containing protein [Candidatus Angelobacter sp.]
MSFYDPETYSYTGSGESISFERDGNIPLIDARFDGIHGRFGVDTGARSALILYGPFISANHIREKYQPRFQGISGWGIGGPVRSYMVRSRDLKIGKFELHGLIARLSTNKSGATAQADKAGLIGPDVLKQFIFICDYARHRLIFEKNSQFGLRDSYDRAGVWLAQNSNNFEVYDVIPGGAADHAALKTGDIVVAVNGVSTAKLALTDVRDSWKYGAPGTEVRLRVRQRTGRTRTIKFVLRDLI